MPNDTTYTGTYMLSPKRYDTGSYEMPLNTLHLNLDYSGLRLTSFDCKHICKALGPDVGCSKHIFV